MNITKIAYNFLPSADDNTTREALNPPAPAPVSAPPKEKKTEREDKNG